MTQTVQVMAVDGSQIGEAHVLKQRTAGPKDPFQGGLDPVVEPVELTFLWVLSKKLTVEFFEMIVGRFAPQPAQVLGKSTHVGVDGHAVVVENYNQRFPGGSGVIEPLISQPAGESTVSNQS